MARKCFPSYLAIISDNLLLRSLNIVLGVLILDRCKRNGVRFWGYKGRSFVELRPIRGFKVEVDVKIKKFKLKLSVIGMQYGVAIV